MLTYQTGGWKWYIIVHNVRIQAILHTIPLVYNRMIAIQYQCRIHPVENPDYK
jgi:hypothetical protein